MKRRAFLKGMAAAGATTLLPTSALLPSCSGPVSSAWDFDEVVDRSGTWSIKQGRAKEGQLAMWIADMDFRTDPYVAAALRERLDRDVLGYTSTPPELFRAVADWYGQQHGYAVDPEWVGYAPGVITALNQAYLAFTQPGDKIVVQSPVYDHFRLYIERLGRVAVENPLLFEAGRYRMDLEGLERILAGGGVKALVLCNPHNPIGVLWPREELVALASLCERYGVQVFSDEIHGDLALYGRRHTPFTSVSEAAARIGLVFAAPTKAFNLAGVTGTAYCVIPSPELRSQYRDWLRSAKLDEAPIFSIVAILAAYRQDTRWLDSLKRYLEGNIDCVVRFFEQNQLGIKAIQPEASFLVWLDCRALGLPQDRLMQFFADEAGIILNNGASYGTGGEGFVRLNIGCPASVVEEALRRIQAAL